MDFIKLHKREFTIIAIILIIILSTLFYFINKVDMTANNLEIKENIVKEIIKIDIKGEVLNPGVYEVDNDLVVEDVINLAGGLTSEADISFINLAKKLSDEMIINIPNVKETEKNDKISLNKGTVNDFMTLPGIGESKAQAIIDYRKIIGVYTNLEEIMDVSGIGTQTFEKIRNYITL